MKNTFAVVLFNIAFICQSFSQSVGGSAGPNQTVCSGNNSGLVTLTGHNGAVVRWQSSTTSGASWSNISNTTANLVFSNLTGTTWYRAEVLLSPSPPNVSAFSSPAIITVDAPSSGTVNTSTSVCFGNNNGTLTLTGTFTSVSGWESSADGGNTWNAIANTGITQSYSNLIASTSYRAIVTNGTCPSVYASAAVVTVNPLSAGGMVVGSDTFCAGSNSGTLLLSGHAGNVVRWQYSDDGGASWTNISNTTTIHNFSNLDETTLFRSVIQSGNCAAANSFPATITVDPPSVGGAISPNAATVCSGVNNGTLTLSGYTGKIIRWEYSDDGGLIWNTIATASPAYTYNNLIKSTVFRALIKNGICDSVYSGSASITVASPSAGGLVTGNDTVCSESNNGLLVLGGYTGNIIRWQYSEDGAASWTNISNTSTIQAYSNIDITTLYRAVVQNGSCPAANSLAATIVVTPPSDGGTIAGSASVCSGLNQGILQLNGYTGTILNWEKSVDNGLNWSLVPNSTDTLSYINLASGTLYRAEVQSGNCPSVKSAAASISVTAPSSGGAIFGSDTVCSGTNSGTLILSGYTGSVVRWQSSDDGGVSWANIGSTAGTVLYNYSNIVSTTRYRAVIQNGSCQAVNSQEAVITTFPLSAGGTLLPANYSVCSGINSGSISLSGQYGSITGWEFSVDAGATWNTLVNTSPVHTFLNLTASTQYRAVVQSAQCAAAHSSVAGVNVSPPSVAGIIDGSDTVCTGNNSGYLMLSGYTGNIKNWEYSTNGGAAWSNISNTSATHSYSNLSATTQFRAVVQSGACAAVNSPDATILVSPKSSGGIVQGNAFVCDSNTAGTLFLSGYTGNILNWEKSADSGVTWLALSNITNAQTYSGITIPTLYRVKVQSGACPAVVSSAAVVSLAEPVMASYSFSINGATVVFFNTSTGNNLSSFWNFGDNTTSGVKNPAHTYIANGTYTVLLVITDTCGTDTALHTITINGLGIYNQAYNNPSVNIFPNPFYASAILSVQGMGLNGRNCIFLLYDIFGKEVRRLTLNNVDGQSGEQKVKIERENLPPGLYFYKLQSPGETIAAGKIVIQ